MPQALQTLPEKTFAERGASIDCVLNGEARSLPAGTSVADLFDLFQIDMRGTAVEINAEVIPRSQHSTRRLQAGDRIEIVRMVGGG